MYGALNN